MTPHIGAPGATQRHTQAPLEGRWGEGLPGAEPPRHPAPGIVFCLLVAAYRHRGVTTS